MTCDVTHDSCDNVTCDHVTCVAFQSVIQHGSMVRQMRRMGRMGRMWHVPHGHESE